MRCYGYHGQTPAIALQPGLGVTVNDDCCLKKRRGISIDEVLSLTVCGGTLHYDDRRAGEGIRWTRDLAGAFHDASLVHPFAGITSGNCPNGASSSWSRVGGMRKVAAYDATCEFGVGGRITKDAAGEMKRAGKTRVGSMLKALPGDG